MVHKYDDIIDSRDIIEVIESLSDEINASDGKNIEAQEVELEALLKLQDEASHTPDWHYGEMLIRDSYFKEYAQELAEEIGAVNPDAHWPNGCIDWDQAARELQADYFDVDFDGVTYWVRG